jgi:hypothetical protein
MVRRTRCEVRLLVTVRAAVRLCGFTGVVRGMRVMAVCRMGVVGGFFVIAGLVVGGGFPMMSGSLLVMLGGLMMMVGGFLGHDAISSFERFTNEPQRGYRRVCYDSFSAW